jgi:hypothetical protein
VFPLDSPDGSPWTELHAVGSKWFPAWNYTAPFIRRQSVQVTATWGWASVPGPVKQACLMQAANFVRRKDNPFGITGFADAGLLRIREDPDVAALLDPYRLRAVGIA